MRFLAKMSKFHDRRTGKVVDLPSVDERAHMEEFGSLYGNYKEPNCEGCNQPEPECEALDECNYGVRRKRELRFD
jgi:hypothetical protein